MWHLNGSLSFSGEYSNNLKNGEFRQFDESEKLIKKGIYQYGKLVSGEPVVQDMIFKRPEINAKLSKEITSINEDIKLKFEALNEPKSFLAQKVKLNLIIDKTGKVLEVRNGSLRDSLFLSVSNKLLKDMTIFYPATVENIPVDSELIVEFKLSKKEFSILSEEPLLSLNAVEQPKSENQTNVYGTVEQMPEYPGGQEGLQNFLARTVRYPIEALQKGIQGKVFVNFVIDETGEVTKIQIAKGVHKSLDQEAIRVVQLMPKWRPGIQDGKPVKVSYTVPISFRQEIVNPSSNWD
jgi:TonB family protein